MRSALIIANTEYIDPGLAQLTAPGKDAEDFARVFRDKDICAFDEVKVLLNEPEHIVRGSIDEFFDQKKPDDLLVLYFSGHGVRDELGSLYLAVKNTIRTRLRSTAIKSDYIREAMDQSRSKRQVLILDCCNSGAFAQGAKAELGGAMGMVSALQGRGRFILTASDATQFAWEGNTLIGETQNSLFTHFLIKGLEGEADRDSDGRITIDELYDYAHDQISNLTPKQTPTKSVSIQEGEIVLRQFTRLEDIKPVSLSDQLISEIENPYPEVRLRAVAQLAKLVTGKNLGLARSAREALEQIEREDDSRRVSQAAMQVLESLREAEKKADEERKAREEAERLATLRAEEERLTREKAEAGRRAKEEAEKLAHARAEREAAEREVARLKVEREAAEQAAREAAEKAANEKAEKEAAERAAVQKAEGEVMELALSRKPEGETKEKIGLQEKSSPSKSFMLSIGVAGIAIIAICIFGYTSIRFLPNIFAGTNPTEPPASGQATISVPSSTVSTSSDRDLLRAIKDRGYIIVSTDPNYAPQSSLNTEGKRPADTKCPSDALTTAEMQGFDVDVAKAIGDDLGVETCFAPSSWDAITAGNWADKWDISVGSMTIWPARQKVLEFSVPYYYTPAVVAVKADSNLNSIDELAGQALCVGSATTYEDWLNGKLDIRPEDIYAQPPANVKVVSLGTDQECAQAIAAGRQDFVGQVTSAEVADANIAAGLPIKKLGNPVFSENQAAAFDKSSSLPTDSLRAEVDKLFTAMHSDGRLSGLSEKWFRTDLTQAPNK